MADGGDRRPAKVVAYYRVSTARQGQSGLGLDAQRAAVAAFACGCGARVVAEFTEVESGRKADRPELDRAILRVKRDGARLVVAKLDRLARNAAFTARLQEDRVPFTACDMPDANELTIGIMSLIAQHEAKAVSERTRAALAAAKARGQRLGNPHLTDADRRRGAERSGVVAAALAVRAYRLLGPYLRELSASGLSRRAIAARLNAEGMTTRRGRAWTHVQVGRVLGRG